MPAATAEKPVKKKSVTTTTVPVTATMMTPDNRERLLADIKWYNDNKARLARKYPKQHLVVFNKEVLDHARSLVMLSRRASKLNIMPAFVPYTGDVDEIINLRTGERRKSRKVSRRS